MAIKIVNKENFERWKKPFLPHVPRITQPKNWVPRSKDVTSCPRTDTQTHRHTYRQTECLLRAPFHGFRIQPIIKDRPNRDTKHYDVQHHLYGPSVPLTRSVPFFFQIDSTWLKQFTQLVWLPWVDITCLRSLGSQSIKCNKTCNRNIRACDLIIHICLMWCII